MADPEQDDYDDSVEIVSDGNGLAVIGSAGAVEKFMASSGLVPTGHEGRDLARVLSVGSAATEVISTVAANSGRWLKLTKESAAKVQAMGLTPTKTPGISHAMIGRVGASKSWLQVVDSPVSKVANPAVLAGLGGVMAQMAMQKQLDAINDYLETIDQKLDDLIRTQMNQVLARVDAVGLAIAEAMTVREAVGRVSEVAWSKVQNQPTVILETQAFALRQLADLGEKLKGKSSVADLAKACEEVQNEITKWLSVLARCFQLHDAHAILELDRVMDGSPDELDSYRLGLEAARRERTELFRNVTGRILDQLDEAATTANAKVLFNPIQTPQVVEACKHVGSDVAEFHAAMGIEPDGESPEARRWREAAGETLNRAREAGTRGAVGAKRLGSETRQRASSAREWISDGLAARRQHREPQGETQPTLETEPE